VDLMHQRGYHGLRGSRPSAVRARSGSRPELYVNTKPATSSENSTLPLEGSQARKSNRVLGLIVPPQVAHHSDSDGRPRPQSREHLASARQGFPCLPLLSAHFCSVPWSSRY
jgi:hypothetical protein